MFVSFILVSSKYASYIMIFSDNPCVGVHSILSHTAYICLYDLMCVSLRLIKKKTHKVSRFNRHGLNKRTLGISAQVNHGNVFRFLSSGYIRISLISQ